MARSEMDRVDRELDLVVEDVGQDGAGGTVVHGGQLNSGAYLEQFCSEVDVASGSGRSVLQLSRLAFGQLNELGVVPSRDIGVEREGEGARTDHRDVIEIRDRVGRLVHMRVRGCE